MDWQNTDLIGRAQCFLFDMDGTIYLGNRLISGAKELAAYFDELGKPYFFLTNNSSRSRNDYVEKLRKLGLPTQPDRILTSGEATALFIKKRYADKSVYLVGTPSLEEEFTSFGIRLVQTDPDIVVLGFDTTLTYEKLRKLCQFIARNKPYLATHPDINCPTEDGFIPDIGSVIALVQTSTGRKPDVIIGKPHPPMIEAVVEKTGFGVDRIVMVGDRLYTDIAMGRAGISTVLVLSGESKYGDVETSPYKPDLIVKDVGDLLKLARNSG